VFRVAHIAKFTPLHGMEFVLGAAKRLARRPEIRFEIVGTGQRYDAMRSLARRLVLDNVDFLGWVPYERLVEHMARANVCLGNFGTSPKARRVVPIKVFATLCAGRALITGDSEAARELLTDGDTALLCRMADADALAAAIARLCDDRVLCNRIARSGRALFERACATRVLGAQFKALLERVAQGGG
jgi:glycosyltransferase involved in cell wall biosynthesis